MIKIRMATSIKVKLNKALMFSNEILRYFAYYMNLCRSSNQHAKKTSIKTFWRRKNDRVATLSTLYLTVSVISMQSLKSKGQF